MAVTYFSIDGRQFEFEGELPVAARNPSGSYLVTINGTMTEIFLHPNGGLSDGYAIDGVAAVPESARQRLIRQRFGSVAETLRHGAGKLHTIKAPMPGLVKKILVQNDERVTRNTPVLILEAMKMENIIMAGRDGTIRGLKVPEGKNVEKNASLCEIEEE